MLAGSAMDQVQSMTAAVLTSLQVTAIAMATKLTPSATAVAIAQPMPTATASVMTSTAALEASMLAASVTAQVRFMSADAPSSLRGIVTAMATNWMPLTSVVAIVRRMLTTMGFVMT